MDFYKSKVFCTFCLNIKFKVEAKKHYYKQLLKINIIFYRSKLTFNFKLVLLYTSNIEIKMYIK